MKQLVSTLCRACGQDEEILAHLATCPIGWNLRKQGDTDTVATEGEESQVPTADQAKVWQGYKVTITPRDQGGADEQWQKLSN